MRLSGAFPVLFVAATLSSAPAVGAAEDSGLVAGRYADIVTAWTAALAEAESSRDARRTAEALLGRAEAYQALGRHAKAVDDLERALAGLDAQAYPSLAARLHGSIGNALALTGEPTRAAEALGRCLQHAREARDPALEARTWNNVGNLLSAHPGAGRTVFAGDAQAAYGRGRDIAATLGDAALRADTLTNEGRHLLERARAAEAVPLLRRALELYAALPRSAAKLRGLLSAAHLLGRAGDAGNPALTADIHAALAEARTVADALGDRRSLSYALGDLGALYERAGRGEEALRLTEQALFQAEQASAPEIAFLWHWQRGRLLRAAGDRGGARASLQAAVATLRTLRAALSAARGLGESFRDSVGRAYLDLVDLLLEDAALAPDREQAQASLRAARDVMELLKTAELEDYFRDECVAMLQARSSSVDELLEGSAALYPILLPDRTELLLSLPGGIERATVPVGAEQMRQRVLEFRHLLEKRTRQYLRPAAQLYDWLVRPFERVLQEAGVETLIFVPSGVLRTVPVAPLYDGRRHLVERYATAVVPGLTLLDARPLRGEQARLLLSGLSEPVQGFEPLPHVAEEIENLRRLFGGEVYQDAEFRAPVIERALEGRDYTIVHVASHARISADARSSFLLTYDGKLSMDELEHLMKLARFRETPVELLTLSACATAAGDERAALGLAGVGVKAGARSALASLWFVNDQASADLVTTFYERLRRQGTSKAQALRTAQLALLDDDRYRFPVFWAPFLLIGNWL